MFGHPTFGFPHLGGGGTVVAGVNTFRTIAPGFTPTLATAGDVVLAGGGTVPVDGIQTGVKQLINTDTTNFPTGDTRAWVESVQAFFHLKTSARGVDNITVVTPLGGPAGRQWVREQVPIMLTPIRNAWAVDTGAGNDENTGAVGSPLKTVSELARRMAFNQIPVAITTTLTGDMAPSDLPYFTYELFSGGSFTITGQPTLIYTGTVTTFANAAAAPTADEITIIDATIPVSFTASGLLAPGLIFHRTNGGASDWFALKDDGGAAPNAKLRITAPSAVLANGDTYTVSRLPATNVMRFQDQIAIQSATLADATVLSQLYVATPLQYHPDRSVNHLRCWYVANIFTPRHFTNCMFSANAGTAAIIYGTGDFSRTQIQGGGARGTGADSFSPQNAFMLFSTARFSLQGVLLGTTRSNVVFTTAISIYDTTVSAPLSSSQFSRMLFSGANAFVSGLNNAKLAIAGQCSQIAHTLATLWVAATSTDVVTPITVNGTGGMTVAAETAGTGVVNAQQNGIFPTS